MDDCVDPVAAERARIAARLLARAATLDEEGASLHAVGMYEACRAREYAADLFRTEIDALDTKGPAQ